MSKVVFITGGGMGIGAAVAKALHTRGAKVALFDMNAEALQQTAAEIGPDCLPLIGSVGKLAELEQAMARTQQAFGRIDAVFANAGIARVNPIVSMAEEEWAQVIDVNLTGVWRTLKAATPHLLASRGYALVTSSAAASVCLPLAAHYTASKAGVLNLAEAYRSEMRGFGIEVGTLHPMFVRTAMVKDQVWGTDKGRRLAAQSKLLFMDFPLQWVANSAARMIFKRKRRATVPGVHLPVLWFPRVINWLANLLAFRSASMRAVMLDVAAEDLRPACVGAWGLEGVASANQ
ncbi:MAG TPA: SDR family NAD(P)-dependent oxidoreductase [Rubrivivax sp.]|nr:SDR family NAD(P)-dependent oxidoreductase [Rubrivivax sp.]